MKIRYGSVLSEARYSERGQAFIMAPVILTFLLAFSALAVDMGNLYFSYQQLLGDAQAAARAGGQAMADPNVASATAVAEQFSGETSSDYNHHSNLNITNVTVTYACVAATTYPNLNLPPCAAFSSFPSCGVTSANPAGGCNAIQVTEAATVPTFFAKWFGVKSLPISAVASASASGAGAIPYHIMMVLDTTASMGSGTDTGCVSGSKKSYSPEQCAQFGIQTLLSGLAPCASNLASCGSNPPVDEVGLMVFPGLCSDTASGVTTGNCPTATTLSNTIANSTYAQDDWDCPAVNPPIASYNNNPEYLVLGFQDNYRLSDSAALNTSSDLFKTVGAGTNNCGLPTPGGEGTFYAGAIYAARDYLYANHTTNVQDVMILLSDGDATATGSPTTAGSNLYGSVKTDGLPLFTATAECQQAVTAADSAKGAPYNIQIYSVSYGSETSGCTSGDTLTPCGTMSGIASTPLSKYFFSVPQTVAGKTSTVCSGAVPITQLNQVFVAIQSDLQGARLIPNGTF